MNLKPSVNVPTMTKSAYIIKEETTQNEPNEPNRPKLSQNGPNSPKLSQTQPNRPKTTQNFKTDPNRAKPSQTEPNSPKTSQINQYCAASPRCFTAPNLKYLGGACTVQRRKIMVFQPCYRTSLSSSASYF